MGTTWHQQLGLEMQVRFFFLFTLLTFIIYKLHTTTVHHLHTTSTSTSTQNEGQCRPTTCRPLTKANAGQPTKANEGRPTKANAGQPTKANAGQPTKANAGQPMKANTGPRQPRKPTMDRFWLKQANDS